MRVREKTSNTAANHEGNADLSPKAAPLTPTTTAIVHVQKGTTEDSQRWRVAERRDPWNTRHGRGKWPRRRGKQHGASSANQNSAPCEPAAPLLHVNPTETKAGDRTALRSRGHVSGVA